MNFFNIERAFKRRAEKGYPKSYWCIDLHDCIFRGDYAPGSEGGAFFPGAERVLKQISLHRDFVLILYSAGTPAGIDKAVARLADAGIQVDYVNENPALESTELCDFSKKFYFDILLDDKAGFNGETDWFYVEAELKRLGKWFEPVTPFSAADMVIGIGGKVVLIKRKHPPLGFAIPGGFQDIGETTKAAAVREAKEETGLDVKDAEFLLFKDDPKRDPRFHVNTFIYYGTAQGEPVAADDADAVGLFTPDEILAGDLPLAFPGIKDTIAAYQKKQNERKLQEFNQ